MGNFGQSSAFFSPFPNKMMFTLLALLTTTSRASGLLSLCLVHDLVFPHGSESADLDQQLCHLVQPKVNANLHCDEQASVTARKFLEAYEPQAQFCEANADLVSSVLDGSHPESEQILDVAFAEGLVMCSTASAAEGRRNLFMVEMISGISSAIGWVANIDAGLAVMVTVLVGTLTVMGFLELVVALSGRRLRALEASSAPTSIAFSSSTILAECAQGVDSFLCELPVNEMLQVFSTGMCASVGGLLCVVSQDDLLALLPTQGGN